MFISVVSYVEDVGEKTTDSPDTLNILKTSDSCQQNSNRLTVSTDTYSESRVHCDLTKPDFQTASPAASGNEDVPGVNDVSSANYVMQTADANVEVPQNIINRNKVCITSFYCRIKN